MNDRRKDAARKVIILILKRIVLTPSSIILAVKAIVNRAFEWAGLFYFIVFIRPGDGSKRDECCGRKPDNYAEDIWLEQIPELSDKLVRAGFTGNRAKVHYICSICGQH